MRKKQEGVVLVWVTMSLVIFVGLCSLAVDVGHSQVVKTQIRNATDAAARAAAWGLQTNTQVADAIRIAGLNKADGTPVVLLGSDIVIGNWNTARRTFTPGVFGANAVKVNGSRTRARGTATPLTFASAMGFGTIDIHASSVAMLIPPTSVSQTVQATANPFLAGMPAGSVASGVNPHRNPDHAGTAQDPLQSPQTINIPIVPGAALTFTAISGTARHDPNLLDYQPDGETDAPGIGHNNLSGVESGDYSSRLNSENGIADMWCPINALVGVFLDDNDPSKTPAPASLDFSTPQSRDFTVLKPQLKQLFFIGDGQNSAGQDQQFVVPKGATRFYLATWDFYEWNNNSGFRTVKVSLAPTVVTVQ